MVLFVYTKIMIINVTKRAAKILPKEWLLDDQAKEPRHNFSDWHLNSYWFDNGTRPLFMLTNNVTFLTTSFYNKANMSETDFQLGILNSISAELMNSMLPLGIEEAIKSANKYGDYAKLPIRFVAKTDRKVMGHMKMNADIVWMAINQQGEKINKREVLQPELEVFQHINRMITHNLEGKDYIKPYEETRKLLRELR
jgi:hypothetical protein